MKACKNSKTYQGTKKPRCNGGKGCDTCNQKFQEACGHESLNTEVISNDNVEIYCERCSAKISSASPLTLLRMLIALREEVRELQYIVL